MTIEIGDAAPDFTLPDTDGSDHSLAGGTGATVVAFTCNHCPYALAWHDRLLDAARDYAGRARVLLVNPNDAERYPADSLEAMRERVQADGGWPAPYLHDESQEVARCLRCADHPGRVPGRRRGEAALPRRPGRRPRRPVAGRRAGCARPSMPCSRAASPTGPRPSPSAAASSGSSRRSAGVLAVALGLGSSIAWGVSDFLGGLKSRSIHLLSVLLVSQAIGLLPLIAIVALRGEPLPGGAAPLWAALGGLAGLIGLASFYRGLSIGAMAVVAPISGLAATIPVAVGRGHGRAAERAAGGRGGGGAHRRGARLARASGERGAARAWPPGSGSPCCPRSASAASSWASTRAARTTSGGRCCSCAARA